MKSRWRFYVYLSVHLSLIFSPFSNLQSSRLGLYSLYSERDKKLKKKRFHRQSNPSPENNNWMSKSRSKHTWKKLRFYFLFILVITTTNSIEFINKPVFLFWFFPCCCFGFTSKAATTKDRQFIYDLSMLCLGLGASFWHFEK
jgi:hypothetical protein